MEKKSMAKSMERATDGVDSVIDRTRDAAVSVATRAERSVDAAAESVKETAHTAGEYVRARAETTALGTRRRVKATAKAIDRGYTRARSDLSRATKATTRYVTEHTGQALLLAASIGFVIGALMRRRRPEARTDSTPESSAGSSAASWPEHGASAPGDREAPGKQEEHDRVRSA
jgi:ElaB/YqjD/DUF883 family membrane-anchored ribosome-binding protein